MKQPNVKTPQNETRQRNANADDRVPNAAGTFGLDLLDWPRCQSPAMPRSSELLPMPLGPQRSKDSPHARELWRGGPRKGGKGP